MKIQQLDELITQLDELEEKEIREKYELHIQKEIPMGPDSFELFKAGYLANKQPTGNQYAGYLKKNNATWAKVRDDEPVFILRAQDNTAPGVVLHWIEENLDTVNEAKIKEALQTVLAMRRYDARRDPT